MNNFTFALLVWSAKAFADDSGNTFPAIAVTAMSQGTLVPTVSANTDPHHQEVRARLEISSKEETESQNTPKHSQFVANELKTRPVLGQ